MVAGLISMQAMTVGQDLKNFVVIGLKAVHFKLLCNYYNFLLFSSLHNFLDLESKMDNGLRMYNGYHL